MIVLVFLLGAVVGSFLNVVVYRVPRGLPLLRPRSFCPRCKRELTVLENIPIVSYLVLRGRCRGCGGRIPLWYFLVELVTGLGFAGIYAFFGFAPETLFMAFFFCVLLVLSVIDLDRGIVEDRLVLLALAVAVIRALLNPEISLYSVFLGAVVFTGTFSLLAILGEVVFRTEALGGGDIIFVAALGAFLGLEALPFTMFFGALFACVFWLSVRNTRKKWLKEVPFVPFLSLAAVAFPLVGHKLYAFLVG